MTSALPKEDLQFERLTREGHKNQYAYQLEGFTDHWIQLGTEHQVTFTNLDPGTYTFWVKGSNNDGIWNETPAPVEDAFLQKARQIIEQHLSDIDFDMDRFSRSIGMSRSQIFRKTKALTGKPPSLFIRSIRLNRAKELLETTTMNISEVAYKAGFSTPGYFSDAFLEAFGTRPSELRS